jgi:hypothetical protein
MLPYNTCENKWLSKTKDKVKNHYKDNETLYVGYFYIAVMCIFVLALLASINSFY